MKNLKVLAAVAVLVLATAASFSLRPSGSPTDSATKMKLVEEFYQDRLNFRAQEGRAIPELPFTKSFLELIDLNAKLCKEKTPDEVCGFGADGDVYLAAQDWANDLRFENSGFKIEMDGDDVVVNFDLFHGDTWGQEQNRRTLKFNLIREDGDWKVNDIVYVHPPGSTARIQTEAEIKFLSGL